MIRRGSAGPFGGPQKERRIVRPDCFGVVVQYGEIFFYFIVRVYRSVVHQSSALSAPFSRPLFWFPSGPGPERVRGEGGGERRGMITEDGIKDLLSLSLCNMQPFFFLLFVFNFCFCFYVLHH
jgi:hypothetical protein